MPEKTKITVFQALTVLARKYRGKETHTETSAAIKSLYLSGVRSDLDLKKLEKLLKDAALANFEVSKSTSRY